jgi:serine/threonine protein kinase
MRWPPRIGRWEIRGSLGAGATAEVLLGEAVEADGVVQAAIKRPPAERIDDPTAVEMLRAEGRALGRVHHPNVVALIELVEGPPPALVLERLRGGTLAELAAPAEVALAVEVGAQAAAALAAVHAAVDEAGAPLELVHRDVAPDNLFVTEAGAIKLFDFNVAFFRGRTAAPAPGALQGRIAYMAPEQARSEPVDGSADVFALGVVLWEGVVGERLLWRGNTLATLRAVIDEPIARAGARRGDVPAALDELIAAMLDRDRRRRPRAAEVAERLRALPHGAGAGDGDGDGARATLAALARRAAVVR